MRKVCLVVIDGWGYNHEDSEWDAINRSECYWMRRLSRGYGGLLLYAHGSHVGLLPELMGNSEVGHLTIGSGRIVEQDIVRIDKAINRGEMGEVLFRTVGRSPDRIHVVGMVSDGGVHSHIKHLRSILEAFGGSGARVYIHCISDGRDTEPCVFARHLRDISEECDRCGVGVVASVAGRYYAMDRANNDERTSRSFEMMTMGERVGTVEEYVREMYGRGLSDEVFEPRLFSEEGRIEPRDTVLFFNFRADRMRQIVERFVSRGNEVVTMTEYKPSFGTKVLFEKVTVRNTLAEVLSSHDVGHTHIAEREKQAHVTYFFNGGREAVFPKQKVFIVPSPDVEAFDAAPEMACREATAKAMEEIEMETPFIVLNLAPPDMVGHTGNFEAAKDAVKATDECVGRLYESCRKNGYVLVVTADHGNAEEMRDRYGNCCKTHTTNKVPLIVCLGKQDMEGSIEWGYEDSSYSLRDVAPTILEIMGIEKPVEMTGRSVLGSLRDRMSPDSSAGCRRNVS